MSDKRTRTNEGLRRHRAKKKTVIDSWKTGPCRDSGNTFHPFVMDFDHRDASDKLFNVSAGIPNGLSIETIKEEADKCDLVCSNCHRMRTLTRKLAEQKPIPSAKVPPGERTHCPQGHPYSGENLRIRQRRYGMGRECVRCVRERDRLRGLDKRKRPSQG